MDLQLSLNEQLMEQIFRLYAVLRRGPIAGGDGEKGGRPSAQNRILLMLGESDGISQRDMTTLLQLRPQSVSETLGKLVAAGLVERRQSAHLQHLPHRRRAGAVVGADRGPAGFRGALPLPSLRRGEAAAPGAAGEADRRRRTGQRRARRGL